MYNTDMGKRKSMTDEVRRAIEEAGISRYAICKGAGISEAAMSRFMHGQTGFTLRTLDRLAAFLDLHVRKGK
jgi:transcriptional regulator with XRE-family HTH domain